MTVSSCCIASDSTSRPAIYAKGQLVSNLEMLAVSDRMAAFDEKLLGESRWVMIPAEHIWLYSCVLLRSEAHQQFSVLEPNFDTDIYSNLNVCLFKIYKIAQPNKQFFSLLFPVCPSIHPAVMF